MKNIKISGISGYNFGDVLLSDCLSKLLILNGVEHSNAHINPTKNIKPITSNAVLNNKSVKNSIKKGIKNSKFLLYNINIFKTLVSIKYYLKIAKNNNHIYYGGGNLISNHNSSNYLFILFILTLFSKKNKITILFSGIGPFSFPYKLQLNYIEKKCKKIIVRDQYSLNFLTNQEKVSIHVDPAILTSFFYKIENTSIKNKFLVNLIDYSKFDNNLAQKLDLNNITNNINIIAKETNTEPIIYVTSIADIHFCNNIIAIYEKKFNTKIEQLIVTDVKQFTEIVPKTKFAIVNRMHAGILATSYSIPTLFFPWQKKITGFLNNVFDSNNIKHFLLDDINLFPNEIFIKLTKLTNIDIKNEVDKSQKKILNINFKNE